MELLVAVAILAVLAALAGVGLAAASRKAKSMKCKSNLHQLGIWLTDFAADNGEYPLGFNPVATNQYPAHATSWIASLENEGGRSSPIVQGDYGGVWICPGARRPADLPPQVGYCSYGYNSDGVQGSPNDAPIGLGGLAATNFAVWPPPVKATEVLKPVEMLALGDAFLGWPAYIVDGRYTVIGLRHGVAIMNGETTRALARHEAQGNFAFCDGHVAAIPLRGLYFRPLENNLARYWNRDNQPHAERFQ